jgi:hypothetical protein
MLRTRTVALRCPLANIGAFDRCSLFGFLRLLRYTRPLGAKVAKKTLPLPLTAYRPISRGADCFETPLFRLTDFPAT